VTAIDPAFYRTELCLATNGDWYLMRDGALIAVLRAPEDKPVTHIVNPRTWARHLLTALGAAPGGWLNGMDLPPADSGYWVTEPQEDAAAIAAAVSGTAS
jgi:hypothetical protein